MKSVVYAGLLIGLLRFSHSVSVLDADAIISMGDEPNDAPKQPIKCYRCTSDDEGACSDEESGVEDECVEGFGCLISEETKPGTEKPLFVRGCLFESADEYKCETIADEGTTTRICTCDTELCNKNWADAGEQPDGPTDPIKCYKCNSDEEGACNDEEYGVETQCVAGDGCLISKETTPGAEKSSFLRDCFAVPDNKYTCSKILTEEGKTLETCACATELCNKNWAAAGEQPDGPTNAPTEPADKTVKCYSCDSADGECDEDHTGTEIDCPVEYGCNIMKNNDNIFTRGCSVTEEPGCTDDSLTHSCNCKTELCNKNWDTAGAEEKLMCYSCDSHEGECDETHTGTEIDCSVEAGCSISTNVYDGKSLFVRGCSGELDGQGCNNEDNATTCICLKPLCNFDWSTAGSTTASSDTTQPGPTIQCYKCDSTAGDCSEDAHGDQTECPESTGCTIRKTTGKDGDDVMIRDCSNEKDALCDTIENGEDGGTTQFCNCPTPLCNADWTSAGSTEVPPHTDKTTTQENPTSAAPTAAPTDAPGAAAQVSSAFAMAVGITASLVVIF